MDIKKCAFSGHRPKSFPWGYDEGDEHCLWLKDRIDEQIETSISEGFYYFICGGAMGVDMWCAECVLSKKAQYPDKDITLELAIPFEGYEKWFPYNEKKRLENIMIAADRRVLISKYTKGANLNELYHKRNKYMVDSAQRLIAVYDKAAGIRGGTYYTYLYAKRSDKEVVAIDWLTGYNG